MYVMHDAKYASCGLCNHMHVMQVHGNMLCKLHVCKYASYMFLYMQVTCLLICELHVCKYASYMFINMQVHDDTLCKSIS